MSERTAEEKYLIWFWSLSQKFGSLGVEMEKKLKEAKINMKDSRKGNMWKDCSRRQC